MPKENNQKRKKEKTKPWATKSIIKSMKVGQIINQKYPKNVNVNTVSLRNTTT